MGVSKGLWNEAKKKECRGTKRHVVSGTRKRSRPRRVSRNTKIVKKVRTLKRLIPKSESRGLDGLLRDTAEYILSLQMRVGVMQIMVKVLSSSEE